MSKGTRLVIDVSNNCIINGQILSVADAMKQYDKTTSKVLVIDNANKIIVASGLTKRFLENEKHQIDIKLIDAVEIESIIPGRIQGPSTLENEGMTLFTVLDKSSQQDKGQAASELTLIAFQQKIYDLNTKIEEALRANPQDEVNSKLIVDLQQLHSRLSDPGIIDKMITEFRQPFEVMVRQSGVIEDIKRRFGFVDHAIDGGPTTQVEIDAFNTDLYNCLMEMMSARDFYRLLAFTAIYKDSWVKLCFGVSCTIFELQLAFTIANNIISTVSFGNLDATKIIAALHAAYNLCTRENVITLLHSLGFTAESAPQIYNKLKELTKEQMKFALQFFVFKTLANRIKLAENPQGVPQAPLPPLTLAELMGNPIGCIRYLQNLPSFNHGVAGPPDYSLENRAITSFREIMQLFVPNIERQLVEVYPNDAPDRIKGILFELLLDLSDGYTDEAMESALAMLQNRLYTCLENLYITRNVQPPQFNDICRNICPGLCVGLRESLVLAVYDSTDSMESSLQGEASDTPQFDRLKSLDDAHDRPLMIVRALDTLKSSASTIFENTKRWFKSFMPEQARPPSATPIQPPNKGHALGEFIKSLDHIKMSLDTKQRKSLDKVFDAFKTSVTFDKDGNLMVSETEYQTQMQKFEVLMTSLTQLANNVKELNLNILDTIANFIQASAVEYEDACHLLVKVHFMFPGNTEALQHASFSEVDKITRVLKGMIEQAESAISNIHLDGSGSSRSKSDDDDDVGGDNYFASAFKGTRHNVAGFGSAQGGLPGGPAKGGRSRSRKRSVSKRTRRKGVAKKQKSKKNKRQSRRKVRRASSRKGRK